MVLKIERFLFAWLTYSVSFSFSICVGFKLDNKVIQSELLIFGVKKLKISDHDIKVYIFIFSNISFNTYIQIVIYIYI